MAIDSTLFALDIPAGTYAVGDVLNLSDIAGPKNVRSGRGTAVLKNILVGSAIQGATFWRIHIRNSDWIDEITSWAGVISPTFFAETSGTNQAGHDCDLNPNSSWEVYAECVIGGTETNPNSMFALIDIDYPQNGGLVNPKSVKGYPTTINMTTTSTTVANGTLTGAQWYVQNVDYLKAGYEYALDTIEVGTRTTTVVNVIFLAFANAAGMGGLQRIIPCNGDPSAIRYAIKYSSKLVKGPMDVKSIIVGTAVAACDLVMCHDYVKRRV